MDDLREVHPAKAELPIEVMESGISIVSRFVQAANWLLGMDGADVSFRILTESRSALLMPAGIAMDAPKETALIGQLRKASSPMD